MASRSLTTLHPVFRPLAQTVLDRCKAQGLTLLVTCTLRSLTEQAELYGRGRITPGPRVTKAKPGQSAHNYGLAMDVVPLVNGKAMWDARHPHWQVYGKVVRDAGLEWAGDWTTMKEFPHCQMANWRKYI